MEWYLILILIVAGFIAGFVNTVAGGGSTLTLPLLMFIGLPANVANGTNRISILLQSIVGLNTFNKNKFFEFKSDYRLALPAIVGSIIGALIAVEINDKLMEKIIGFVMIGMILLVIFKPEMWLKEHAGQVASQPSVLQYFIFFLIGFYGGFIQIGVGFFLMAGLVMGCGYDLVKTNAIKVFIVLIYTVFALGIFVYNKQVDWLSGLILAIGSMFGAWAGAHFTIKGGAKYIRYVLIVTLAAVTLKLLGVF